MITDNVNDAINKIESKVNIALSNGKRSLMIPDVYFGRDGDLCADQVYFYFRDRGHDVTWKHSGYGYLFEFYF